MNQAPRLMRTAVLGNDGLRATASKTFLYRIPGA